MTKTMSKTTGHYHDPSGRYDYCDDPGCPRARGVLSTLPAACRDHEGLPMVDSLERAAGTVTFLQAKYGTGMIAAMAQDASYPPCCRAAGLALYFMNAAYRAALGGEGS